MQKNLKEFLTISICLMILLSSHVNGQQAFKTTQTSVIGYLEYLPQDYNTNSDKYPVVIFLHGIGERGPNTTDVAILEQKIGPVTNIGPPMHIKKGSQFPFILISPQLKNNYSDWPSGYVMEVINHIKTYLRIDEKRIYLTGLSLGGGGVWWTAQDFPKQFAAIAPVCGSRNTISKACLLAAENLPVWAFHGDRDTIVPMSRSVNMVNAINACTPTPNPQAKMTIYTGVAHDSWTKAYTTNNTYHTPNVYDWMMSFKNTVNGGNKIPTANAGADISSTTSSVVINGSATDTDGTIATYTWKKLSGGSITLANSATKTLSLSGMTNGIYILQLTVTDNSGNSDSDYVRVSVNISTNTIPVANAGSDKNIELPTSSVTLSGSGTDADGSIASYSWASISGPLTPSLSNANLANASVTGMTVSGSYVFRLTVKDNKGASASDNVTVIVNPDPSTASQDPVPNVAPVSNAGADKTIRLPVTSITLTGSGTDVDGTIVSYLWGTSTTPVTPLFSNENTKTVTISGLTNPGAYIFKLRVTDNAGVAAFDHVTVNVLPSNQIPIANAGADKVIQLPVTSVTLTGGGTDSDGTITSYLWGTSSVPIVPQLTNASSTTVTITGLTVAGSYVFKIKVTDNLGAFAYDHVSVHVLPASQTSLTALDTEALLFAAEEPEDVDLANNDNGYWKNTMVTVYAETGSMLYSGEWSLERYQQVFQKGGFYIYKVIRDNAKIFTGKLIVRD